MLTEMHEKYGSQVEFISITKDGERHPDGLENTRKYVADEGLAWLFGEGQHVVDAYEATKIPHTVFISPEGDIAYIQQGFMELEDMDNLLKQILNEDG